MFSLEERLRAGIVRGIKLYPGYENYAINDPSLETVMRIAGRRARPAIRARTNASRLRVHGP
jgi:hypothetical protein